MQSGATNYVTDYITSAMTLPGVANPSQQGQAPTIGAQQFVPAPTPGVAPTPLMPEDVSQPMDVEAAGLVCSVQLPVCSASPTQAAWCSVSNLLAVAFNPDPGSSTAPILIIEPSNAEDVTRLEMPMAGRGDWITSLEWSWPGQRRALLSATASGRVVVWTQPSQQPSQQGQDDSVFPRCIDDWHGQLLYDAGPTASSNAAAAAGGDSSQPQLLKQEPGVRPGAGGSTAAPYLKQEPDHEPESTGYGRTSGSEEQRQRVPRMQPALAGVCWLRQPMAGRSWSTSSLAMKRLDAWGEGGGGPQGQGQAPQGGGTPESFDTLFCDEAAVAGAVPHWARPTQLTAAVLTSSGCLTILWVMASKLPNTLSWYCSKNLRIPPPPEAEAGGADGGGGAGAADGGAAGAAGEEWRISGSSICAVHDGSLAVSVLYGRRRDAVYLYSMRGNPTLGGTLLTQPCGGAGGGGGGGAAPREQAAPSVVSLTARLPVPHGLSVRHCRIHVHGGSAKRLYVLARKPGPSSSHSGVHQPGGWPPAQGPHGPHPVVVYSFVESADEKAGVGGGGGAGSGGTCWRAERATQQLLEPYGNSAAAAASGLGPEELSLDLGISVDGSKLVVPYGSSLYTLDSETLTVLAVKDIAQSQGHSSGSLGQRSQYGSSMYGNGTALSASGAAAAAAAPDAQQAVLAVTGCLSANSCCLCSVVRLRRQGAAAAGLDDEDDDDLVGDDGGGDVVMISICTVPDVVPPPSGSAAAAAAAAGGGASLESIEDTIACNMDTMRLAWGALHRLSVWDVAERLRCAWLAGRTEHVCRSLDQLDGLLYGIDDPMSRTALSQHMTRVKLEVLRRLPHPQAAVLAADLLAGARVLQYSDTLSPVYGAQTEVFSHPESKIVVAHMIWFVMEVVTLMLAGLKLWAESNTSAKDPSGAGAGAGAGADGKGGQRAAGEEGAGAAGGGGGPGALGAESLGWLPLIRLFPDYNLQKHVQAVLLGTGASSGGGKAGGEGRTTTQGLHPSIQEILGAPEAGNRARLLVTAVSQLNRQLQRVLSVHVQGLLQRSGGGPAGPGSGGGSLVPGAPVVPLTSAEADTAAKGGELPRALMQRTLQQLFPGPFHLHYCRAKGLLTPALLAQAFRSDEMTKLAHVFSMSRETLLERYRALGLQAQLLDSRQAPHAAARKLWMSFRAPAPPPELHSHIFTQYVSSRQRQRWRRQRGAALALGSSAPLWANAQGPLVDCLTSVPLPPGASWSLEGAAAVGAVTAQMGPGVGAAASRRNLPPLLAAVQRAWVCLAPPAELGSQWKRARLGLEQDLEY